MNTHLRFSIVLTPVLFLFVLFITPTLKRNATVGVAHTPHQIQSVANWYKYLYSGEPVALDIFGTTYYGFDEEGSQHWAHMLPASNNTHLIQLYDDRIGGDGDETDKIYTVALFHQLKCLEIYNRVYLQASLKEPPSIIHHCLNYLRQQVLCQIDTKLEPVITSAAPSSRTFTSVCRDWTRIYEAAGLTMMKGGRNPV